MAIQHADGSVTLNAEEFATCAHSLEMSPTRFFDFLAAYPDGWTREQLREAVLQRVMLSSFTPETPAN